MITIEIETAALEDVASRSRHDVDGAVAREAAGRIEIDCRQVKFLDDILGNLQQHADRSRSRDVRAINRHSRRADAWNRLDAPPSDETNARPSASLVVLVTPGSNLASSRKFRPFSGTLSICSRVTTPPT